MAQDVKRNVQMARSAPIVFPNACARMVLIAPRLMAHASANVDGLADTVKIGAPMVTLEMTVQNSAGAQYMQFVTGLTAPVAVLGSTKGSTVIKVSTAFPHISSGNEVQTSKPVFCLLD